MNDVFSLRRLGLLIRKFTKEHIRMYLLYTAGMAGILFFLNLLAVLPSLNGKPEDEGPSMFYVLGMIFGSGIFSANFYGFFNNKAKGIRFLNLPASISEKLAVSFLFTQLAFFATYIIVYYFIDQTMCAIYNNFHTIPRGVSPENYDEYKAIPLDFLSPLHVAGLILAFVASSVAHFGSLCFEKHAFIKVALIVLVGGAAIIYSNYFAMTGMIPEEVMPGGMFYSNGLRVGNDTFTKGIIRLPESWDNFVYWFMPSLGYSLFWVASYFKMKEKQV